MSQLPSNHNPGGKSAWQLKLQLATGKVTSARDRVVFLLFDTSGSMADQSKLDRARRGALGYFDEAVSREFDVGVIVFDDAARLVLAPQGGRQAISDTLANLDAGGTTDMAAAIRLAETELLKVKRERVMCIITDGVPNDRAAALAAAENARLRGVDIMAIGTDDADAGFLGRLVSRRELSRKVERESLTSQITSMAMLLPRPSAK